MVVGPLEWVVIAVIGVVFLMFGPKKIPELARSLGQARKEFARGSTESPNIPTEPNLGVFPASEDALIQVARKLGISTEGKTSEEISSEIVSRKMMKA